jgi:hypothetical protein
VTSNANESESPPTWRGFRYNTNPVRKATIRAVNGYSHAELARKVDNLEKKYDSQFKVVFDALRQLMQPPPEKAKRPIGFHAKQ